MNQKGFTLESIYEFVRVSGLFVIVLGVDMFCQHSIGYKLSSEP